MSVLEKGRHTGHGDRTISREAEPVLPTQKALNRDPGSSAPPPQQQQERPSVGGEALGASRVFPRAQFAPRIPSAASAKTMMQRSSFSYSSKGETTETVAMIGQEQAQPAEALPPLAATCKEAGLVVTPSSSIPSKLFSSSAPVGKGARGHSKLQKMSVRNTAAQQQRPPVSYTFHRVVPFSAHPLLTKPLHSRPPRSPSTSAFHSFRSSLPQLPLSCSSPHQRYLDSAGLSSASFTSSTVGNDEDAHARDSQRGRDGDNMFTTSRGSAFRLPLSRAPSHFPTMGSSGERCCCSTIEAQRQSAASSGCPEGDHSTVSEACSADHAVSGPLSSVPRDLPELLEHPGHKQLLQPSGLNVPTTSAPVRGSRSRGSAQPPHCLTSLADREDHCHPMRSDVPPALASAMVGPFRSTLRGDEEIWAPQSTSLVPRSDRLSWPRSASAVSDPQTTGWVGRRRYEGYDMQHVRRGGWVILLAREECEARELIEEEETREALLSLPASAGLWGSCYGPPPPSPISPDSSTSDDVWSSDSTTSTPTDGALQMSTEALVAMPSKSSPPAFPQHPAFIRAARRLEILEELRRAELLADEDAPRAVLWKMYVYEHRLATVGTLPAERFLRQWIHIFRARQRCHAGRVQRLEALEQEARVGLVATSRTLLERYELFAAALVVEEQHYRVSLELLQTREAAWTGVVLLHLQEQVQRFPLAYGTLMSRAHVCGRLNGLTVFANLAIAERVMRDGIVAAEARRRLTFPSELALRILCDTEEPQMREALVQVEMEERNVMYQVVRALETHYGRREVEIEETTERQLLFKLRHTFESSVTANTPWSSSPSALPV